MILAPEDFNNTFDEATEKKFAHFNRLDWLPEWVSTKPVLPDNLSAPPPPPQTGPTALNCVTLLSPRIFTLKGKYSNQLDHVLAGREVEDPKKPETDPKLQKAPHPGADFSHVDTGSLTPGEQADVRRAIKALRDLDENGVTKKDGELNSVIQEALEPLSHANALLDVDPKGMQRLKLVFEWMLCHVLTIYGEINAALDNPKTSEGKSQYNNTRNRYVELLRDLDDPEPETQGIPRAGERGYGRALKWAYIVPLIHGGKIKAAKVIAKWNPHVSSSGIPICH